MIIVQLGNKQLKVPDESKEVYLALGYSVIDEKGEIVEAGHATDLAAIKAENNTLKSKLAEYKDNSEKLDQFEALQKENEDLKTQLEAATKKTK
ncbi:hypothetical protein [Clostridium beijerinckii]|uniref:hypothetical protein n=1 Tax=Clostridium beijerinckii TaxID=1520 RepID=UPI001F33AB4D|nr:hypothetical protein [Clostridium beijerinckii]